MKFTYALMTFFLGFTLATTTYAQTSNEGTSREIASTDYTIENAENLDVTLFTVNTNPENTVMNVTFELREAALGSIELVSMADGVGQILDEQVFDKGMHNRVYYISHLDDGEYYCVIKAGSWTGAHSVLVENRVPFVGPVVF